MKEKLLNAVTAVNGFTECVNECQTVCLAKKKKKNQNKIGCVISAHQKELKIHLHIHSHIIH